MSSYLNYKSVMCFDVTNCLFITPDGFTIDPRHTLDKDDYKKNLYIPINATITEVERFLKEKLEEVNRKKEG
ncbi:MAG: hypothetical protein K2X98_04620 [Alphaproteobacteria bacterium]|nr:hypothetical protein [Alphaproteobacteria bacterium]